MKQENYWRMIWRQFRKDRLAVTGLAIVVTLVVIAVLAPFLANDKPVLMRWEGHWYIPHWQTVPGLPDDVDFRTMASDPSASATILMPPIPYSPTEYNLGEILKAPSELHWFGTDNQGRDVASRIVHGTRISLSIGFIAIGIAAMIGILLGALSGFYGGGVDMVISRVIEVMYCFPTFFLILAVLAFLQPSIYNIMIVIGLTSWTGKARLVRGEFFKLRGQDFVSASTVVGASDRRIMFRHILPNAIAPVLVTITFGIASAILVESGLSFLGFGVPPYEPSWGGLLASSRKYMDIAWWLTITPGFAIFLTITAYNLVGEGLRDAIDPRMKV